MNLDFTLIIEIALGVIIGELALSGLWFLVARLLPALSEVSLADSDGPGLFGPPPPLLPPVPPFDPPAGRKPV